MAPIKFGGAEIVEGLEGSTRIMTICDAGDEIVYAVMNENTAQEVLQAYMDQYHLADKSRPNGGYLVPNPIEVGVTTVDEFDNGDFRTETMFAKEKKCKG